MNLYVFSIGGSGVRVLHSLTMLLAAGIKMQSAKVIPVIIDTDETNGNTDTTLKAIENYRTIYDKVSLLNGQETKLDMGKKKKADKTEKVDKTSVFTTEIDEPRIITISGTKFGDLKNIVGENANDIDPEMKKMLRTIYNDENLDMPLTYGFIGHPNVGSVVLSYLFQKNEEFRNTVKGIGKDDKIFLISSIFGGTGAAGFPLLLNIFNKSTDTGLNKKNNIKGALSVTPYYQVSDNSNEIGNNLLDSEQDDDKLYKIDSALFDAKTFAAQLYYDNYIDGDIDIMYYIGDKKYKSLYPNYLGGKNQRNPAHIVEVYGALSIVHFDNQELEKTANNAGSNKDAQYANSILESNETELTVGKNEDLRNSLIRLWMFRRFYMDYLPKYLKITPLPTALQQIGYTGNNYSESSEKTFSKNSKIFLNEYKTWAEQLEGIFESESFMHNRKFKFVDINADPPDELIHDHFTDYKPKTKKRSLSNHIDKIQSNFLGSLNSVSLNNSNLMATDVNTKLVRFAAQVIDDIINTKMN